MSKNEYFHRYNHDIKKHRKQNLTHESHTLINNSANIDVFESLVQIIYDDYKH